MLADAKKRVTLLAFELLPIYAAGPVVLIKLTLLTAESRKLPS